MKYTIALICLAFAFGASAQEKKAPTEAQKKQQQRMKDCNAKAEGRKGDDRKKFMGTCLSEGADAPSPAQKAQQQRMSACNKQATEKKLKGEERKAFMSSCLKN